MAKSVNVTVKSLSKSLKVQPQVAYGLLKYLEATKVAEKTGTVEKKEGTKGKGATVYSVPTKVVLNFEE